MTITKVEAVSALRDLVESVEAINAVHKMFGRLTRDEWRHLETALKLGRRWVNAADGPKAKHHTQEGKPTV